MTRPKLRRVFAFTALLSVLSILPAQAMGGPRTVHEGLSFSARFERLELLAWNFLVGLLEKRSSSMNPDGVAAMTNSDGLH